MTLEIRERLLARNTAINLVGQMLPLAVAVVAMPFIVRGLGTAAFGILGIAWMLLGYVAEIGFGRATTKFAAEALGQGSRDRLCDVTWATIALQAAIGISLGVVLALITPWLASSVLRIPDELIPESVRSLRIVAAMVPALLVGSAFRGVLEAAQRFDIVNLIRVPASAANFLLPLVAIALGWGLTGVVAVLFLSRVAVLLAFALAAFNVFPELRARMSFAGSDFREIVAFGSWITVSSVVGPLVLYLDRFVLGALVGVGAVAYYTAPYELVTRLWVIPASLNATLFPAFSTLTGQGSTEGVHRLTARSLKFMTAAVALPVVLVIAGASDLLRLWIGPDYAAASGTALQLLAFGVLMNSIAHVPYSLLQSAGRADIPAKLHVVEVPLHLALAFALIPRFGVTGAALAWTIRIFLDAILLFVFASRTVGLGANVLRRERLPHTVLLFVSWGAAAVLVATLLDSPAARIALLCLMGVAMALSTWRIALADGDRAQLRQVVAGALAR